MSNPLWNPKLVSENGVLRATMGVVQAVSVEPLPARTEVRLGLFGGDGQQVVDVVMPILGSYVEIIEPGQPVMVIFMGDTYESGVVIGRVDWF